MRKRRTRDIVIELTSLLDVVMILIFAVMIENSRMVKASEAEVVEANAVIEEMRDELRDAASEKERMAGELKYAEDTIDQKNEEIERAGQELERSNEMLEKANEAYEKLSDEKDIIDEELKVAQRKLSEGDVEELLAKIANAEKKMEGYEYLKDKVLVFNVGVESIYAVNDTTGIPLYRQLTYGRTGTSEDDVLMEFKDSIGRTECIEHMNAYLVKSIGEALANENTSIYIVFSYHDYNSLAQDTDKVQNALLALSGKYTSRVYYSTNMILDKPEE